MKTLLPPICERCGKKSLFPLRELQNIKYSERLKNTTAGCEAKMICAKCESTIFGKRLKGDPAIPYLNKIDPRWAKPDPIRKNEEREGEGKWE